MFFVSYIVKNIFSHCGLPFSFFLMFFDKKNLLIATEKYQSLRLRVFRKLYKKKCSLPKGHKDTPLYCLLKALVLLFTLKFLIHEELILCILRSASLPSTEVHSFLQCHFSALPPKSYIHICAHLFLNCFFLLFYTCDCILSSSL